MTTVRSLSQRCAATLLLSPLLLGTVAACASFAGHGDGSGVDLQQALAVDLEGYGSSDAGNPPTDLCTVTDPDAQGLPEVAGHLGTPTSVGYFAGQTRLEAFAWTAASAGAAESAVDAAVEAADECDYELIYDSDTDGDGDIDTGGSEVQSGGPWSAGAWTGVAISTETTGPEREYQEIRFVRSGDVVLLVEYVDRAGDPDSASVVDTYLVGVAERLG